MDIREMVHNLYIKKSSLTVSAFEILRLNQLKFENILQVEYYKKSHEINTK